MRDLAKYKNELIGNGFTVIEDVFTKTEIAALINIIERAETSGSTFRKNADLFAIRQFLKEIPKALPLIFTKHFQYIINDLFGTDYFVVKSIYFDKPGDSNWFVAYHQDLTISVDQKVEVNGFGP